jgi:ribosome recycling factor
MNPFLEEFQTKCQKITDLFTADIATIKTGRAKPSLVEHIKVNVYGGSWMEIRELASISAPDAQHLVISPWDKSVLRDMEKGLAGSEAKINPIIDGEIIRINIPPLTEESRRDLVKLINQKAEAHKAMVRQERSHAKKNIEDQKDAGGVSEDDIKRDVDQVQKVTDETIAKIDSLTKEKEAEVMKV